MSLWFILGIVSIIFLIQFFEEDPLIVSHRLQRPSPPPFPYPTDFFITSREAITLKRVYPYVIEFSKNQSGTRSSEDEDSISTESSEEREVKKITIIDNDD